MLTMTMQVMLLKYDKVLDILMCASNHADATYVQLWDILNWSLTATVQCDNSSVLVDCAMLVRLKPVANN